MSSNLIVRYLNLRTLALFLLYAAISFASYWTAYELRFDFHVSDHHALDRINTVSWVLCLQLMLLLATGQFDSILSYFRLPDVFRLFGGLFFNALILLSMWYLYQGNNVPPRSVILVYVLISFLLIASFRVLMRIKSSRGLEDWLSMDTAENVIIIGAGEVGAGLCSDLMNKTRLGMRPVAFLDDDPKKIGRYVHGILVANEVEELSAVAKRYSASKAVIAFPSASVKRMRQVADLARHAGLAVDTVPALTDLVSGRAELSQLRPIQLEDLLGRETVDLNSEDIRNMLTNKRVLITGAGGSIGSELVAQILDYVPAELLCIDQTEIAIFNLQQNVLKPLPNNTIKVTTRVLDILNEPQLQNLFIQHRPQVIFHAAAHKHVNLMEDQPVEALRNNFIATKQLAKIASTHSAERFILISTDKAINPTSVMGATKRLAELALASQQRAADNQTKFMAVRFGNVLGSSGSVIPIFRKQIAAGGPITVTHPEVTRFFMTVKEAVGLVLQSATLGVGGEIFVLDMGQSVKILDVARQMIALSGLREKIDIDIEFIGLQPGEKLFEEVQHLSEELLATSHPRVMRFVAPQNTTFDINQLVQELEAVMQSYDAKQIKLTIKKHVPEYTPAN
ncbi:nucleoside-diphosphate sugar epimerase/dehydratase [Coraliomargarita sp. SDUM461004]|uniref:Nucleoside-diphosphate sugar epimerase/dehydratase n=1 Tax=Thalassobacterium sedimentorum TaxID=3041258 RepID=A0ABU1AKP6_9BACT|nr:nucleoside-diphosphate sugar epimerase/dehydratase [Coraliomargarita sp. SDUM461004]MDQ8195314.1 nucleoside-diphosphate sugar epimerase/dehydratase [Coraliomargarita sp. SDUM461004]